MKAQLKFLQTMTLPAFKRNVICDENADIKVMQKEGSDKFFIVYPGGTGAATRHPSKYTNPMISLVEGDNGQFYMLHELGEIPGNLIHTF